MISSLDSNLLVYAHNKSAPEHAVASTFVERLIDSEEQVLLLHQTIFELFSILSNPVIVSKANPEQAWDICLFYFQNGAIQTASYEPGVLPIVQNLLREKPQRGKRVFDLILAATLKFHGVRRLYTRNEKHFRGYDFLEVINPL